MQRGIHPRSELDLSTRGSLWKPLTTSDDVGNTAIPPLSWQLTRDDRGAGEGFTKSRELVGSLTPAKLAH